MNYKYIRLSTGENVICIIEKVAQGQVNLVMPMIADLVPSLLGTGTVMKLSPLIPYTKESRITVNTSDIVYSSEITDQFVDFYDKGVNDWLKIRDELGIEIRSPKDELREARGMKEMLREHASRFIENELGDEHRDMTDEELEMEFNDLIDSKEKILH